MSPKKIVPIIIILIGLLLPVLSFTSGGLFPAELSLQQSAFEVTPGSKVVVNFEFYETFGTRDYAIEIVGNGIFLTTGKVNLDYKEIYQGSLSFNAPTTPGTYYYKTHTYMYAIHPTTFVLTKVEFGYDVKTITVKVIEPLPSTYTLSVNVQNENGEPLSGAEVLINTGVIGTTTSTGIVTKSDLIGSYTVTATKVGYNSASASANMIQDQTVTLILASIPVPTPTPTPAPTAAPTGTPTPDGTPDPDGTPIEDIIEIPDISSPTSITCKLIIEILDDSDPQKPLEDVKINLNGNEYYTNSIGVTSISVAPGTQVNVVVVKEGYNTFEKTYNVNSDTSIKITLPESGGDFFLDLNLSRDNPFYDPEGLFDAIPYSMVIISVLLIIVGSILFVRIKE